jgi:pimeloyl-ACP methyl ester carboxylesterase
MAAAMSNTPGAAVSELPAEGDFVVMLHGLGRTRGSLRWLARQLQSAGYHVLNAGYPSRRLPLSALASGHIAPVVEWATRHQPEKRIHFVTHSLGGLVVREFLRTIHTNGSAVPIGRLVMLCPPNQGSDVLARIGRYWVVRKLLGPVAAEITTGPESAVHQLGPSTAETGIIMGSKVFIPFFLGILEKPCDGIVPANRGRLEGMKDFIVLPVDHTFPMFRRVVRDQVLEFLRRGCFVHSGKSHE